GIRLKHKPRLAYRRLGPNAGENIGKATSRRCMHPDRIGRNKRHLTAIRKPGTGGQPRRILRPVIHETGKVDVARERRPDTLKIALE
ncbi:hypothetical protein ACSTIN_23125, partial [Vibrio parahaemolyticus]